MFKKVVSSVLIVSQIGLVSGAFAASGPSSSITPEMNLLENVIALEGQKLPSSEMQASFSGLITEYAQTAPAAGQQERMEAAMVQLNLVTPGKAHALMGEIQSASQSMNAQASSKEELSASVSAELSVLAVRYPAGAQFSTCDIVDPVGLGYGAAVGSLVGGVIWAVTGVNGGPKGLETAGEVLFVASIAAGLIAFIELGTDC